jgi:acetyltransferase-like isoleucine patch superfamily enzyme
VRFVTGGGHADDEPRWNGIDDERRSYEPWLEAYGLEPTPAFAARVAELGTRRGYDLHPRCVIAPDAHVVADRLTVGDRTTIAAGCVVRGEVTVGAHCSLNAGAVTIGRVVVGDLVRIASYAVLVGENHVTDDLGLPIAAQGLRTVGVVIEDDVWIGAHVTVVDGVTVGAHSVVAAGAVVTADVAPWSVVAGVPARVVRDRRDEPAASPGAAPRRRDVLARFDDTVATQWSEVLARCEVEVDGVRTYVDVPGASWSPRPLNDAVEIAGAFGAVPPVGTRDELVARIRAQQDPRTGLFPDPETGPPEVPLRPSHHEWDHYGVISCGYALEVLGSGPAHPVHVVEDCIAVELRGWLDRLDWGLLAWPSGSWIDAFATAAAFNRRHHGSTRRHQALWSWLAERNDPVTGMWARHLGPDDGLDVGWLMAVNGYYRMTRGTYAQFDRPLPHPEAAVDTVLAHARRWDWFAERERNACNVLDVVHPLWLLGRQTSYRAAEVRDGVARLLRDAVAEWVDGAGVPWQVGRDRPGLQGTEMWLSIVHLAADVLGESSGLAWRPRGVHRLEPIEGRSPQHRPHRNKPQEGP